MGEREADELRYTAFLSYSHKDAAAAGRLHRRLETYRMPKRLVGAEGARGPVPARLAPIFRDRDELPAASDLSETVRAALARSGALIILCSPHAAESLWVGEEIKVFRELHRDRPILAAVIDGDPPDCFPAALRAFGQDGSWHEPLATDLRPHRDGMRLGLLKLVAGITGVGLDALVQRDAARRIRRVMTLTAVALIALLLTAGLAVAALRASREAERQRAEAERQRAEAEGLSRFMLTDLRTRLREAGRLDIMETVNERVLTYHDRELQRHSANPVLRARLLHAIGEDRIIGGHLDAALRVLREAHGITGRLLAAAPADPERLRDHGQSEFWIGRVYELRQDWPAAQQYFARYAAAADRLIAAAPRNPDYMMEVAWSAVDLGNVQLRGTGDYAGAQNSYEKAIAWFGRVVQARPRDAEASRAQANAYAWLADSFFYRRLWRESLAARWRQYRIVESQYRADPANFERSFRLAAAERGVARSLLHVGDRANARRLLFTAYGRSLRLTERDPSNAEWLLLRASAGCELYYLELGLPVGADRRSLRRQIRGDAGVLAALHNPRLQEISHCVAALPPG